MREGTDDVRIFNWGENDSPAGMRNWTNGKLLEGQKYARYSTHGSWIQNELTRRQNLEIAELIEALKQSTDNVHKEVMILTASSERLEGLTKKLNKLTWVLIFLTIALIGIEIWKTYHEPQNVLELSCQRYRNRVTRRVVQDFLNTDLEFVFFCFHRVFLAG